jgi:hypothetical protein
LSHSQIWAGKLTITDDDLDYLTNLLLERETPLSLEDLALALIENRVTLDAERVRKRFAKVKVYRPSDTYAVGDMLMFTAENYDAGKVTAIRPGNNPEYGDFHVLTVQFDEPKRQRSFASQLTTPHALSELDPDALLMPGQIDIDAREALNSDKARILEDLRKRLIASQELVRIAGKWFPRSLVMDVNVGHMHLAEAVLDINDGGPMTTDELLEEIGGVGNAPQSLQLFSLNYALSQDNRFDEIGPTGRVLWYLTRMEPQEVRSTPGVLQYTNIDYDPSLLSPEMLALEEELDDEHSPLTIDEDEDIDSATITLIYPHRRMATFPLNAKMRHIFPTALRAPRVYVTLVDGLDGEESVGWVVREDRYVFGVGRFYRKHKLPIGAYITVHKDDDDPGRIIIDFNAYRPRTEYVKLISPKNNQMAFEEQKRSIGAEYDSLMILGTDDIGGMDALAEQTRTQRRPLAQIIRNILLDMGRFSPQSTVHAKTIYSTVNVVRRCPPGPILATLISNPDFEYVGNLYWKLAEKQG